MACILSAFLRLTSCLCGAVLTGEEEEETVYQVRGKLFVLSSQNQWKERGTGMLRLNVRREDGGGARLSESISLLFMRVVGSTWD